MEEENHSSYLDRRKEEMSRKHGAGHKVEEKTESRIDNSPDKIDISKVKDKVKKNPWMMISIILGVIVVILLIMNFRGGITGNVISADEAGANMIEFAQSQGAVAELIEVNDVGSFYEVVLSMQGQELPLYVTKDGESFTQALIPLTGQAIDNPDQPPAQQPPADVPKSDKPEVELFIMSFCPYGTQAEKGILPVLALLEDKIDFKLRVVHYLLHGEKEDIENKRELCIREEQGQDKLNKYLVCILDSENPQEPSDVTVCEKESGIDSAKLQTCMDTNADNYFESDSQLSEGYGVKGSPTLVINGARIVDPSSYSRDTNSCTKSDSEEGKCVVASIGRSPSSYLAGICSAFNDAPEECNEVLNSDSPSPGFGYNEGTDTVAQC